MSLEVWLALVALFGIGGLTPGPAVMLVMSSSFRYGAKPAMLAALGIAGANVIWLLLAASGAATLLTLFPKAFLALKVLGVLVILYIAIAAMFGPLPDLETQKASPPPKRKLFSHGVALQLSSPMPLVFFGLLLPAYFDASYSIPLQVLIMFVTVTITELIGLGLYAYGAQSIRSWLTSARQARIFNIIISLVMIASRVYAILSTTGH